MSDPTATILVVDDNDAGRFAKVERLRRLGYQIVETATGQAALDAAASQVVDVVLLDVHLPDISGLTVCARLKSAAHTAVPVLLLSNTAIGDADRVQGLDSGADAYLPEPVSGEVLVATIGALLRVRRAELALAEALASERAARREADQANRLKDDFLATLSHELRTPLNAMVGWTWHLRHAGQNPAIVARALEGLERSTAQQIRLINDLMDVSRIAHGKLELEPAVIDLDRTVRGAVDVLHAALSARQVHARVVTVPARVRGDAARLQQVFVNLLSNAIQFSEDGGEIDVTLETADGTAVVDVRDRGRGIAPELLPHIFDKFRQGDSGTTRRHGGLGLGLTIVHELVHLHQGTVHASSEGLGHGATFTVRLPLSDGASAEVNGADWRTERVLQGRSVLVVDDDADSRRWLQAVLEQAGANAITASSADTALDALDRVPVDVLVSDIGMPEVDGIQLIESVRHRGCTIPAVAATAFASPGDIRRILAAGYARHLAKPIQPAAFVRELADLLREPDALS